ncbi:DEAD/DEAH box helicase [Albibacterium sp.]|jgi:SNF2 family DNA or RNA helicase|uniref:DEAD/DEAH box helicase n=1 Tax=Albibacterium sp. TaxID=2952885 RepID=UPI002CB0F9A5|nr:DEAD/DEAH box helicase [Albibacterium sp.]HUH17984.1 DEAD/DEAH box helicase [Albibacterium sp.]
MEDIKRAIGEKLDSLRSAMSREELAFGQYMFNNGECQILTQSGEKVEVLFSEGQPVEEVAIFCEREGDSILIGHSLEEWNRYTYAALLQFQHELVLLDNASHLEHIKYSREGMMKRVLQERRQKAFAAKYRVDWADNIYGDHSVTNENGIKYKVFLRDFENETGYSNSRDAAINKLGTTKHIMYVFNQLKENKNLYNRLGKTCPFVEVYLDPLNEYRITWFYPHALSRETELLIRRFFGNKRYIDDDKTEQFSAFLDESKSFGNVVIRPEVYQKIEKLWETQSLNVLRDKYQPDFSGIRANLYEYQKGGIRFAATRKSAIIADEMGLGKTIQAIGAALEKKELFGFKKVLIVCPASLKAQWKAEIEKFSGEQAVIVSGLPGERAVFYRESAAMFAIVNYEMVLRDQEAIRRAAFDFMILDEAQRVKNFETKTAHAIKQLNSKHTLIITGTPIENQLVDLFSLVGVLDDQFLGPLWEFSYQHCLFDATKLNKINGYYNLQELKQKLESVLIRREKRKVIEQLPQVQQHEVRVGLTGLQQDYHASYANGLAQIVHKKFLTPYDLKKMQLLLTNMRMVCDSSFLVDEATHDSPKLEELKYILVDRLDIRNSKRKVIIFSEWVKMHKLIGKMLRENNIGFTELNGKVPVTKRGELIKRFETSESCQVFLSTEAGGAGLNLQMADILINFELPWNPAKKNQRIGRIDRIGQRSSHLTIFNFISNGSIEERIAQGLLVKQSLFDGVLNGESLTDFVDFSEKGRSQFLQQVAEMVDVLSTEDPITPVEEEQIIISEIADPDPSGMEAKQGTLFPEAQDVPSKSRQQAESVQKAQQMEQVMNNGLQFLSGLFEMATGNKVDMKDQKIEIDPVSGEVTMKFKMPLN